MCPHKICEPSSNVCAVAVVCAQPRFSAASVAGGKVSSGCAHSSPEVVYVQDLGVGGG